MGRANCREDVVESSALFNVEGSADLRRDDSGFSHLMVVLLKDGGLLRSDFIAILSNELFEVIDPIQRQQIL